MKKILILITLIFMGCSSIKVQEKVSTNKVKKINISENFNHHLNDGESHIMDAHLNL